jgi:hypothetical protein
LIDVETKIEAQEHIIVHIDDDAGNWLSLPKTLQTAIQDFSEEGFRTVRIMPPSVNSDCEPYPSCTTITWRANGKPQIIKYWLITKPCIDGVIEHLIGKIDITFIVDIMQARSENVAGLKSTLNESLASIRPYVSDQDRQVRLFTAYSAMDGVSFPENVPEVYRKGVDTQLLVNFLLGRIGIRRSGGGRD